VEDFWAERFLVYPKDPSTGTRKPGSDTTTEAKIPKEEREAYNDKLVYTTGHIFRMAEDNSYVQGISMQSRRQLAPWLYF
jgi:hypothetical protein